MILKGHLYQHMDSRGGTAFVAVPDKAIADELYLARFWGGQAGMGFNDQEYAQFKTDLCSTKDGDYAGEADLEIEEADAVDGHDLDEVGMVLRKIEGLRPFNIEGGHLLFTKLPSPLAPGDKTQVSPIPGYEHPRWDDDAYGFVLILPTS